MQRLVVSEKHLALALFVAAAAWPTIYGSLTLAALSPLDRAIASAWCGAAPHGSGLAFLGHCMVCWVGAAALAMVGAMCFVRSRHVLSDRA